MGYGLVEIKNNKPFLICAGVVQLDHYKEQSIKLKMITVKLQALIREHQPNEMSVEAPFYGVNPQSMLKLGRAQGAAMVAGAIEGLVVCEYSPKKVKQSITGNGNASKEQVAAMLKQLLKIDKLPKFLDCTDALGLAMTHFYQMGRPTGNKSYTGWKAFVKANPSKIKK